MFIEVMTTGILAFAVGVHCGKQAYWHTLYDAYLLLCNGDFSNGNTDASGSMDEGRVRAFEMLQDIERELGIDERKRVK